MDIPGGYFGHFDIERGTPYGDNPGVVESQVMPVIRPDQTYEGGFDERDVYVSGEVTMLHVPGDSGDEGLQPSDHQDHPVEDDALPAGGGGDDGNYNEPPQTGLGGEVGDPDEEPDRSLLAGLSDLTVESFLRATERSGEGTQEPGTLIDNALRLANDAPDDHERLTIYRAIIDEGISGASDAAVAALLNFGELYQGMPEWDDETQREQAELLADSLAAQKQFAAAEQVVAFLAERYPASAVTAISKLLKHDYTGQNQRYLDPTDPVITAGLSDISSASNYIKAKYLAGLAQNGQDVLGPISKASTLFTDILQWSTAEEAERFCADIALSSAKGGDFETALTINRAFQSNEANRQIARLAIADVAIEKGEMVLARQLVQNTFSLREVTAAYDIPPDQYDVKLASIWAKLGEYEHATELCGAPEALLAYDQAMVHSVIYESSDQTDTRQHALDAALECLRSVGVSNLSQRSASIIESIANADVALGNTVLSDAGELVPRVYGEINSLIPSAPPRPNQPVLDDLTQEGFDPMGYEVFLEGKRQHVRDVVMAKMAGLLAGSGALQTARKVIDGIYAPEEKARAMVRVAQRLRGL